MRSPPPPPVCVCVCVCVCVLYNVIASCDLGKCVRCGMGYAVEDRDDCCLGIRCFVVEAVKLCVCVKTCCKMVFR